MLYRGLGTSPAVASFPAPLPLLALDHVLVRPRPALRRVWRHDTWLARRASDHLPLVATLAAAPRGG